MLISILAFLGLISPKYQTIEIQGPKTFELNKNQKIVLTDSQTAEIIKIQGKWCVVKSE